MFSDRGLNVIIKEELVLSDVEDDGNHISGEEIANSEFGDKLTLRKLNGKQKTRFKNIPSSLKGVNGVSVQRARKKKRQTTSKFLEALRMKRLSLLSKTKFRCSHCRQSFWNLGRYLMHSQIHRQFQESKGDLQVKTADENLLHRYNIRKVVKVNISRELKQIADIYVARSAKIDTCAIQKKADDDWVVQKVSKVNNPDPQETVITPVGSDSLDKNKTNLDAPELCDSLSMVTLRNEPQVSTSCNTLSTLRTSGKKLKVLLERIDKVLNVHSNKTFTYCKNDFSGDRDDSDNSTTEDDIETNTQSVLETVRSCLSSSRSLQIKLQRIDGRRLTSIDKLNLEMYKNIKDIACDESSDFAEHLSLNGSEAPKCSPNGKLNTKTSCVGNDLRCKSVNDGVSVRETMKNNLNLGCDFKTSAKKCAFRCHSCKQVLTSKTEVAQHVKNHIMEKMSSLHPTLKDDKTLFVCEICKKSFHKKSIIAKHMAYHFPLAKRKCCIICSKSFYDYLKLKYHYRKHKEGQVYHCHSCNNSFYLLSSFLIHKKEPKFKCGSCNIKCCSKYLIRAHIEKHLMGSGWACPACKTVFKCEKEFKQHCCPAKFGGTYSCSICNKIFQSCQQFENHMLGHKGKEMWPCDKCPNVYRTNYSLQFHALSHKVNYQCDICNKSYRDRRDLEIHRERHNISTKDLTSKTFKCEKCGLGFSLRRRLVDHLVVHGLPLHKCKICNKSFMHFGNLRVHRRIHSENRYKCRKCPKEFVVPRDRERHELIHTNIRPFKCHFCSKAYPRHTSLKRHQVSCH